MCMLLLSIKLLGICTFFNFIFVLFYLFYFFKIDFLFLFFGLLKKIYSYLCFLLHILNYKFLKIK
jgi:hypothetical protein